MILFTGISLEGDLVDEADGFCSAFFVSVLPRPRPLTAHPKTSSLYKHAVLGILIFCRLKQRNWIPCEQALQPTSRAMLGNSSELGETKTGQTVLNSPEIIARQYGRIAKSN